MNIVQNEHALISALKQSDRNAFGLIFSGYWKKIYAIAYHRLGNEDEADDLVQDLFLSLWEKRETLHIKTGIEQYLIGAVKFRIIDLIRSKSLKDRVFQRALEQMHEIQDANYEKLDYKILERTIDDALEGMPEKMRLSFQMRNHDMKVKDISSQLGIAEQTVRNNIAEATRRLKLILRKKYPNEPLLYTIISLSLLTIT